MTETNPPKSAKKPRWTSLEIGLITIVSLLFIVIVALVILFATQKTGECWKKNYREVIRKSEKYLKSKIFVRLWRGDQKKCVM